LNDLFFCGFGPRAFDDSLGSIGRFSSVGDPGPTERQWPQFVTSVNGLTQVLPQRIVPMPQGGQQAPSSQT